MTASWYTRSLTGQMRWTSPAHASQSRHAASPPPRPARAAGRARTARRGSSVSMRFAVHDGVVPWSIADGPGLVTQLGYRVQKISARLGDQAASRQAQGRRGPAAPTFERGVGLAEYAEEQRLLILRRVRPCVHTSPHGFARSPFEPSTSGRSDPPA